MLQMSVTVEKGLKYMVVLPFSKLAINLYKIPLNVTLNNCSNTCSTAHYKNNKEERWLIVSHLTALLLQQSSVFYSWPRYTAVAMSGVDTLN